MSREVRLFIFLVLWLGMMFGFVLLFPPRKPSVQDKTATNQISVSSDKPSKVLPVKEKFLSYINTNDLRLTISESGVESIFFSYKGREYELSKSNYTLLPFSLLLGSILSSENPERLYFDSKGNCRVEMGGSRFLVNREFIPVSNYVLDMVVRVRNEMRKPIVFGGVSLVFSGPLGPDTADERFAYMYLRTGYIEKKDLSFVETLTTSIFTGTERYAIKDKEVVAGVWMENRYTVVGMIPIEGEFKAEFVVRDSKYGHNKVMSLRSPTEIMEGGDEKVYRVRILLAPRKNEVLEAFGYGFKALEDGGILKPVYDLLKFLVNFFFSITGSWGVAVILISVAVKLLLEPLSIKAAVSMKRLQLIAPKIKEIQEKYKSDPKKMNAEIAELYRIYGANPASGCLPLLLQIPIFIALYNVLSGFIELKGQGILWIKDLTKPDTVLYIKELEGFFILPASINLLPIIMTGVSLLQTYITSSKTQSQQTLMMWLLPIIFMFIFWNLPSALVLYWTIQTLLGLVEQYVINKTLKY
ncbi:MAG: YidC/Oxa1 family membrane protein insertase [Brevinematia bacterium]